jgi:hypothetical protein
MDKLNLIIELSDAPALVGTLLSCVYINPSLVPRTIRIVLDEIDGVWLHNVTKLDITPLLRILCSTSHPFVTFFCRVEGGDWISPILNRISSSHKLAWRTVLETDVHQVLLSLRNAFPFEIVMSSSSDARLVDEGDSAMDGVWNDTCPAICFMRELGIEGYEEINEVQITRQEFFDNEA